ncbi:MAG: ATP-dependent helicase [Helicobacteraceae bacterium]|jgi:DNA helicase-2/ATP-dependent DNA helicase PcrA|nr:ATP-dependent helicase [Helicobacteraceae bacterium]
MPLSRLNKEQLDAASAPFGYNLIIAGAGVGKTSAIVGRIAHLLKNGVSPETILLLTFTNKAAGEMIARIAKAFGQKTAESVMAGTFHSVSYKWLRDIGKNILLKRPSELKTLFKTVYDKYARRSFGAENILSYSALFDYKNLFENRDEEDFGDYLAGKNRAHKANAALYTQMFDEYETLKEELGFAGFNDLLILMRRALKEGAKNPYREVLVDEYQDTNPLQNALLEAINPPSLFCVGDYDQSIYAFNGADIGIISEFERRYKNAKVWTLTKNYRSTAMILSLANRVIAHNKRVYDKELLPVKPHIGSAPSLLMYGELYEQYRAIAAKIAVSRRAKNEIAVLFRNNSSADGIEAALRERGLPCKRRGGNGFFESREIKAALDLIGLTINPRDLLAFVHIMEYASGIGSNGAKELYDASVKLGEGDFLRGFLKPKPQNSPLFGAKEAGLFSFDEPRSLKNIAAVLPRGFENHPLLACPQLNEEAAKFLGDFWRALGAISQTDNPKRQLEIIADSPLFAAIASRLAKQRATKNGMFNETVFDGAKERIFEKLRTLKELSDRYRASERFINAMALGSSEMSEGGGVNLLSVHAAKGLEFDEVFVIDLMDGRFPNRKLMTQGGAIEEERRLFYVAVTRARETLFLSFAARDNYKKIDYAPSQFLYEAGLVQLAPSRF